MKIVPVNSILRIIVLSVSLTGLFLYFGVFNRFHLSYLEQNQLFRYNADYLSDFFSVPGGLITLAGSFLTQFFHFPWAGAIILTLIGALIIVLSQFIFRKTGLHGILFSLIPLLLLAALQSNHNHPVFLSLGWIISLACVAAFISIENNRLRFWFGIVSFVLLYFVAGFFSILTIGLEILYELLYKKGIRGYRFMVAAIFLSFIIPLLGWKYIYLIPVSQAWLLPVSLSSPAPVKAFFYPMLLYFPLVLLLTFTGKQILKKTGFNFSWKWQYMISGAAVYFLSIFMLIHFAYDRKNELFLSIDFSYQSSDWEKVLDLSNKYPGNNQLVLYFTNIALYKSGNMADKMFQYRQSGTGGLWLEWKRNETAPFFGGEVFYHLGYNNEAFRWAFEAMEAKGLNPRSLKRLAATSLINGNYALAGKYLNYLDQTLFYRKWAKDERRFLMDTTLINRDNELGEKRKFLLKNDFIADINVNNIGLNQLLVNHPENRMAFEYLMASCLLKKDLNAFAANIYRLNDLGYEKIPTHYEEALVLYQGLTKNNIVPAGFQISNTTRERFRNYAHIFAASRNNMDKAAHALSVDFGNTFWFYMQFASEGSQSERNSKTG
ncbi:MAG TPA: DUF6057 family protein [Bacteroidales bacterium]|nr:DUF6057 family protein [Bacteroidales bacterium]